METNRITHPLQAMSMGLLDHVEERGLQKGQRELLRKQLETRFGTLPLLVEERLANWPADQLTELGTALLSAKSLQELGLES
jgi:hypothetical protein